MKTKHLLLLPILIYFVACTHTELVTINPDYNTLFNGQNFNSNDNKLKEIDPTLFFSEGKYSSANDESQPLTSTRLTLVHSYDFYPDRSLNDILFEGMQNLIQKSGHRWNVSDLKKSIRVDIKYLSFETPDHFSEMIGYDAQTLINIRVEFYDNEADSIIYGQNYYGTNTNIYGDPDMTKGGLYFAVFDGFMYKLVGPSPELIKNRYGSVENKTFHTQTIFPSLSANWDLFYESTNYTIINLFNKIGSDENLKEALENYISNKEQ